MARLSSSGGLACNFTLQAAEDSGLHATGCDPDGASESAFVCQIRGLLPGTPYRLTAISNGGGEESNTSVRTGESTCPTAGAEVLARGEPVTDQGLQTWPV